MTTEFRDNKKAELNLVYNPPDKIQETRKRIYKRYQEMRDARVYHNENIEGKWDKWEKQYEAWRPKRDADDWQSNITPPFTTTVVERALAEIVDQTIRPKVQPRGQEDFVRAKLMNYIVDYTWEIADGDLNFYAALKQALILGKTIWQEDYWQDKREVNILKNFDLKTKEEKYEKKDVYDYDDVYGETVNIRNFFIDPAARTVNNGRYKANDCIRRYIMSYTTFMENFQDSIYDQFGDVKYVKPGGDLNYFQFYAPPENINKEDEVEVLFYWGRRPDKLIIVANDVVIRDGPNPYAHKQLPFAEGSDVPRLNQFWARGEPALLESIQDEMTTLRRMRIDRQHMDIWKMFMVSNRENLDEDEAIIAPSRFLFVDDPKNSIVPVEYKDINPSAYLEEDRLKQDGREVTGLESPQPAGTATEAAIFKESTMKALRLKIWLLSRELMTNIVRLRVPNVVQYYSVPKAVQVLGEKKVAEYRKIRTDNVELELSKKGELIEKESKDNHFFIVLPEMIVPQFGGYDLKMSGEPSFPVSKPLQQQKTAEFMQHPVVMGAVQNGYYSVNKLADSLSEVNDYDPERFREAPSTESKEPVDEATLIEMANSENEMMLQGQNIPSTAYATRTHSQIHLAFMKSQSFKDAATHEIIKSFSKHITGEEMAQDQRAQADPEKMLSMGTNELMGQRGPGAPPPGAGTPAAGIQGGEAQAAQPNKIQGPEMTPQGGMPNRGRPPIRI